ncbi:FCS-Like Zinc finger 13 [Cardamine amara subsp. amara]|uniref:FCS-Like Zinc finger 13 n=1 Tax=Cardamine amara subsp. amara TaxID=228776 RepID=A0ABD1BDG2_CARAN
MILSKRPHLMIRKLSEMLVPRSRSAAIKPEDYTASPRSPLDLNFPSPVNSKRFGSGGVGLGIVAALEETNIRHDPVRYSGRFRCPEAEIDLLDEEEYTYVTSCDGSTKVYYSDDGFELCEKPMVVIATNEPPVIKRQSFKDTTEFLSSCCLCKKKLQGKDIYMYKGEMGFCSSECRSVQIMKDERNEQCKSQVSRNVDVSSSSCASEQSFSAGIFVF